MAAAASSRCRLVPASITRHPHRILASPNQAGLAFRCSLDEAWEKVLVGYEFVADVHNTQNCIGCHGAVPDVTDVAAAHKGVVRDPPEHPESADTCRVCHTESVRLAETSLHQNLNGYHTALEARGPDLSDPAMLEAFANHCDDCHTTCGQCHISRPTALGGGLLREHTVRATASMKDTCLACHGARVADGYHGKNEGVEGSVRWLEAGIACYECHDITHYHGDGTEYAHRYDGPPGVDCLECRLEATPEETDILEHKLHDGQVACEVCHVFLLGDEEAMPPQGKYNTGQKLFYLVVVVCMVSFIVTGLLKWSGKGVIPVWMFQWAEPSEPSLNEPPATAPGGSSFGLFEAGGLPRPMRGTTEGAAPRVR